MQYVNVIQIREGVVFENTLFIGDKDEISKVAESKFLAICSLAGEQMDEDEKEQLLDDGYKEFSDGSAVCLSWPDIS